jgi:hypothetical protein
MSQSTKRPRSPSSQDEAEQPSAKLSRYHEFVPRNEHEKRLLKEDDHFAGTDLHHIVTENPMRARDPDVPSKLRWRIKEVVREGFYSYDFHGNHARDRKLYRSEFAEKVTVPIRRLLSGEFLGLGHKAHVEALVETARQLDLDTAEEQRAFVDELLASRSWDSSSFMALVLRGEIAPTSSRKPALIDAGLADLPKGARPPLFRFLVLWILDDTDRSEGMMWYDLVWRAVAHPKIGRALWTLFHVHCALFDLLSDLPLMRFVGYCVEGLRLLAVFGDTDLRDRMFGDVHAFFLMARDNHSDREHYTPSVRSGTKHVETPEERKHSCRWDDPLPIHAVMDERAKLHEERMAEIAKRVLSHT